MAMVWLQWVVMQAKVQYDMLEMSSHCSAKEHH